MFKWKKARHCWNDELIQRMRDYKWVGKRDYKVKSYHNFTFIENLLAEYENEEELNKYNYSIGVVFKWIKIAMECRKKDVVKRLNNARKARENRENKIDDEAKRKEEREAKCIEEKEKFEKEKETEIQAYHDY